ncbi:MAG: ATP-binding cassette domain-containing protein [Thermoproteota archaeon]
MLGPNGCGKTTLIKCLCDILKLKDGEILLNGGNTLFKNN